MSSQNIRRERYLRKDKQKNALAGGSGRASAIDPRGATEIVRAGVCRRSLSSTARDAARGARLWGWFIFGHCLRPTIWRALSWNGVITEPFLLNDLMNSCGRNDYRDNIISFVRFAITFIIIYVSNVSFLSIGSITYTYIRCRFVRCIILTS